MRWTLTDMSVRKIAKLTGISPSAVSLALNGSPKISKKTRAAVLKASRKLGYRRNAKVTELMSHVRISRGAKREACLGVISFYEEARPWEKSMHLSRIYDGMALRAEALGYRLEPLWLRAPGMTYRRFRAILDARGVEGLLCFGSPNLNEEFPSEFDHYAIVTQGLSIKTPLHRVVSHVYNDMWRALNRVYELGYRRPGLVIGRYEEIRSAHAYLCAYLGWAQITLGTAVSIPVLQLDRVEEKPLLTWLGQHNPDVVIFVHHYDTLGEFNAILRAQKIRVPRDLGVAVISQSLADTEFSGLQENQHLIGSWCVELLVARIMNRDFGIPSQPRIEMVERRWIDGKSLRLPTAKKT
jgi:LacI family transcriptional regulator